MRMGVLLQNFCLLSASLKDRNIHGHRRRAIQQPPGRESIRTPRAPTTQANLLIHRLIGTHQSIGAFARCDDKNKTYEQPLPIGANNFRKRIPLQSQFCLHIIFFIATCANLICDLSIFHSFPLALQTRIRI